MGKELLVGVVEEKQTIKVTASNNLNYFKVKVLKATKKEFIKVLKVECSVIFSNDVRHISKGNLLYIEFENLKEEVILGRTRLTVKADFVQKGYSKHFRKIEQELLVRYLQNR